MLHHDLSCSLQAFLGVAQFFIVVFASLVIGVSTGMAAAMISRFSSHVHGNCLREGRGGEGRGVNYVAARGFRGFFLM